MSVSRIYILLIPLCSALLVAGSFGQDAFDAFRKDVQGQIEDVETEALFKEAELSTKYLAALEALEKKLTATGDLDAIVHLREERESVQKNGSTTSHADKPLVELRDKYTGAIKVIRDDLGASREKIKAALLLKLKEQETALTKAGKVDDAIALRKETERMLLELSAGGSSDSVTTEADPRPTASAEIAPLKAISIPVEKPPVVEKPFAIKGRWLESMTIPPMKMRVSERFMMGDRGKKSWILVNVSPGSVWTGGDGVVADLSAGKFVATKSTFKEVFMAGDLGCNFYFLNSVLDDCGFAKGGVWYGSDQAACFYFENSVINKRFGRDMNITDTGFRAQTSVFQNIDFGPFRFHQKQPGNYVNHPWLRLVNCRFVNCKVPLSVVMITRDCIFENCTLEADPDNTNTAEVKKPLEITVYLNNSKVRIPKLPENVKLIQKMDTEWKGVTIPTAASLLSLMGGM